MCYNREFFSALHIITYSQQCLQQDLGEFHRTYYFEHATHYNIYVYLFEIF